MYGFWRTSWYFARDLPTKYEDFENPNGFAMLLGITCCWMFLLLSVLVSREIHFFKALPISLYWDIGQNSQTCFILVIIPRAARNGRKVVYWLCNHTSRTSLLIAWRTTHRSSPTNIYGAILWAKYGQRPCQQPLPACLVPWEMLIQQSDETRPSRWQSVLSNWTGPCESFWPAMAQILSWVMGTQSEIQKTFWSFNGFGWLVPWQHATLPSPNWARVRSIIGCSHDSHRPWRRYLSKGIDIMRSPQVWSCTPGHVQNSWLLINIY